MMHRKFRPDTDLADCRRIWREVGWVDEKSHEEAMEVFLQGCRTLVGEVGGRVEALALSTPGSVRYLDGDLSLCAVCGVTTGYAGRRRGLAGRLTAELIALDAAEGAELAGLGIFDQGYYDKLGFGTGPYEVIVGFDPATLDVPVNPPPPIRLSVEDWDMVHRSRHRRMLVHGNTSLDRPEITRAEMLWSDGGFGLGYLDDTGEFLTHHLWCGSAKGEHGPYTIQWLAYSDYFQLLELLGLIRNLGDQVHLVKMLEPQAIQLQDFLRTPFRSMRRTGKSEYETFSRAMAFWQLRICDLPRCMERTVFPGEPVTFNLRLRDPILGYLEDDSPWKGAGGDYIVTLGPESSAESGHHPSLQLMEASIGAFTRMWLGVRPASGLRVTDDLCAPDRLIGSLDRLIRLPLPRIDWEY
ncbi:MAG: hypothetical protein AVO35_00035 [Candidatus Aegiribacteria sp. MLS_C]|nr:MAG: hypothetical protein AVO35_00035 [Candidatus Aegiribacteria sp. MLS_C]